MKHIGESWGLYIHIPFCERKCLYCDFVSYAERQQMQQPYIQALLREISSCKARTLDTIFLGGGTPSCLKAEYIAAILDACRENFSFANEMEITIEANPATLTQEKLRCYQRAGINRISMGVQSLCDTELRALGRLHTRREAEESFELARKAGFRNMNLDVMFGIPGQTMESLRSTLERICQMQPEHISAYSLIVEPGTPFEKLQLAGKLAVPDEDTERDMYDCVIDTLADHGYIQYEISNFSKPGLESRHNLKYWTCRPYLGVGLAAHSYDMQCRFSNTSDLQRYITNWLEGRPAGEERILLTEHDRMAEYIIMGLRLCRGIDLVEFEARFACDFLAIFAEPVGRFCKMGLMSVRDGRVALTRQGFSVSNRILCEFV